MRYFYALILLLGALFLVPDLADAENHTVLVAQSDDGGSYFFEPKVLQVSVGDNVTFVWGNGSHNVAQVSNSDSLSYESGFRSGRPADSGPA